MDAVVAATSKRSSESLQAAGCVLAKVPKAGEVALLEQSPKPASTMQRLPAHAQAEVVEQVRKLTQSGRILDPLVEQCVGVTDPKEIVLCLLHLPEDDLLDGLRRSLRDLFVVMVASGLPKKQFTELLKAYFGERLTDKLRSQIFLAHHHVFLGKFAKSACPRAPRQHNISLLLRAVSGAPVVTIAVDRNLPLRECQQDICKRFKKSFPRFKACLVFQGPAGPRVYNDFIQYPFRKCPPSDEATVVFEETDDPYFYDLRDRRGTKKSVKGCYVPPLIHI